MYIKHIYYPWFVLVSTHEAGDHVIFVGEVLDVSAVSNGVPLLFKSADFF